jgi:septal ring factor EnvC (AmiA/AmiB activator)
MRKFLISIVLASATVAALPAAAEAQAYRWDNSRGAATYFQREINQLENQIQRSYQRRAISSREAATLRRDANQLERRFDQVRRNGIDRRESAELSQRLDRIHDRLHNERRDRDGRRG